MKQTVILISFLVCFSSAGLAQVKDIGIPFITNFNKEGYGAGTQNWEITQDDNGFVYFANNNGILRFNGKSWHLFPLPNNSIVRSVEFIDGRIYAGGFDEFGYFQYNQKGNFTYTSISDKISKSDKGFDEIWRIHKTRYGVVFQSYKKIFILNDNEVKTINPPTIFGFSYVVENNLFVVDRNSGLYILQQDGLKLMYNNSTFFTENEITFIFSSNENSYLIGTTNNGIYNFIGNSLIPWNKKINRVFLESQIYSAVELPANQIAVGSIQDGIFIIGKDGRLIQHLNRYKGLQNNTVLSLFFDRYENLWLGLDNGIDVIETSNPISILNYCYNIETSYTSIIYKNNLYVGTNQGLFVMPFTTDRDKQVNSNRFKLVENTKGQVWSLNIIGGELVCGHNLGTFIIKDDKSIKISDIPGGWTYVMVPGMQNLMIGGSYRGLILFKRSGPNDSWVQFSEIDGFEESCREIIFDKAGLLWVTHGYNGIYKLTLSNDYADVEQIRLYNNSNGLPKLPYTLSTINNKLLITARDGLYYYNSATNDFVKDGELNLLLKGEEEFTRVIEDQHGDIWFFTINDVGVLRLQEDGRYVKISIPFNRIRESYLADAFENIFVYNQENVFIGGQRGMFHYDPNKIKDYESEFSAYLSYIRIKQKENDSLLYELYLNREEDKEPHTFPYKYNSISFSYLSTFLEKSSQTVYSYRLVGYENEWSQWSNLGFKEYTNLFEGDYIFEVKAKNIYDKQSNAARFKFTVRPPLYRSLGAYVFYSAIVIVFTLLNIIYFRRKIERARKTEKLKHERVLMSKEKEFKAEVEQSEQEIERLRADKLKNDMRHKNMELANATMHLIQKNKFLTKLKSDLMRMWGEAKVNSVKSDIKEIVKKIDRDFKNEQHWQVFDQYFDEVHQDFLKSLKEKHPVLTPNDLRLCAYLKMNLSTKEIAPLMNISIRGLEISRYRLRKKLELNREDNLTDYILNI